MLTILYRERHEATKSRTERLRAHKTCAAGMCYLATVSTVGQCSFRVTILQSESKRWHSPRTSGDDDCPSRSGQVTHIEDLTFLLHSLFPQPMRVDYLMQCRLQFLEPKSVPHTPQRKYILDVGMHFVHPTLVRRASFLDILRGRDSRSTLPEDGLHDQSRVHGAHEQHPAKLRDSTELESIRALSLIHI